MKADFGFRLALFFAVLGYYRILKEIA